MKPAGVGIAKEAVIPVTYKNYGKKKLREFTATTGKT